MRIEQLRLEDFKLFHRARIDFRPLTLLTGMNSSGKSTVLNAITSILHTQPAHTFPFEYVPSGRHCSLGSFRDVARGKSTRTKFSLGISITDGSTQSSIDGQYRYSATGNQILPNRIKFRRDEDGFDLVWTGADEGYKAIIYSKTHNELTRQEPFLTLQKSLLAVVKSLEAKNKKKSVRATRKLEHQFGEQSAEWFKLKSRAPLDLVQEISEQPAGQWALTSLSMTLKQLEASTNYVAPVRVQPSRYYQSTDSGPTVDSSGKNAISVLYEWKKHSPKRFAEVVQLLKLLELASGVQTRSSLDEILKLDVQPFRHQERVNLADVGFGLSQALPIVISDVALPKGGTLIINQPEVHLHPSSQAQLGTYFASRLKQRSYLIETHSEYLINRLRLLVMKEKLTAEDVAIIFIESPVGSRKFPKIHSIEIGKDGSLVGAPKGFFETYFHDTFNLALSGFSKNE